MKRIDAISLLAFLMAAAIFPGRAHAQQSLFVGIDGANDTGPCTVSANPCFSLQTASSKINTDGASITCVQNALFVNSLKLEYSITVDCKSAGQPNHALTVVIDAPGKTVRLKNLNVQCAPVGCSQGGISRPAAILILQAASVMLDNVTVLNSQGVGIMDRRTGPGKLIIVNSRVNGATGSGIVVAPQGGTIAAVLDNVSVSDAAYGLAVGSGGRVLTKQSIFSGNATTGVHADSGGIIELEDVLAAMNPTGVFAAAGSSVSISNSRINSNNTGIVGSTTTYGGNKLFANATDNGTPPTPAGTSSTDYGLQ